MIISPASSIKRPRGDPQPIRRARKPSTISVIVNQKRQQPLAKASIGLKGFSGDMFSPWVARTTNSMKQIGNYPMKVIELAERKLGHYFSHGYRTYLIKSSSNALFSVLCLYWFSFRISLEDRTLIHEGKLYLFSQS